MTRLLLYDRTFERIGPRLPRAGLDVLLMNKEGEIRLGERVVDIAEAAPDAAWLSADVLLSRVRQPFFAALAAAPALKWAQSAAAGFDSPAFKTLAEHGAVLTNNHAQAVGMAEYVLWGVLDHLQRGPERRAAQGRHEWLRLPYREIAQSRWLIIGFGAIGQAVAERAKAFGARITGVRRSGGSHPLAEAMATPHQIAALLPEADVVILAIPLSDATADMANAAFFAAMKPGSVLVNVGRGGLVDEDALLAALDKGVPEHALLDVFKTEPLPADSPFWAHPRVTLTSHASPMGSGLTERSDALFLENLRRFMAGEPLLNAVDPKELLGG